MSPKRYNLRKRNTPVVWVDDENLKTKNDDIEDEEFHKLRYEFLENMKKIRKYVEDKIDSYEEEY